MSLSDKTKKGLRADCDISLKRKTVLVTGAKSGDRGHSADSPYRIIYDNARNVTNPFPTGVAG